MKRLLFKVPVIFLLLALCSGFTSARADAASPAFYPALTVKGYSTPVIHTREEILKRVKDFEALKPGSPYLVQPGLKNPYKQGELNSQFLNQGLAAVNFYRFLSGLPADIKIDNDWAVTAQYGAALLAILNKGLSHTPAYPEGINMPRDFYDRAYQGTSTSNLHSGQSSLAQAVGGFIYDSDNSNIDRLGHRRWVLNPSLNVTGLGFANGYSSMKVFGQTSVPERKENFLYWAWPAAGEMPLGYFPGTSAWSFSLNPMAFGNVRGDKKSVTVKLTRIRDGKTWSFGGPSGQVDGYYNIETSRYGLPFCVIFRPGDLGLINDGDVFEVNITGIKGGDGKAVPVKYRTGFFSTGDRIETSVVSKHPKIITMDYNWGTIQTGRKSGVVTNGELTMGYVGIPLDGFSIIADSPEGIIPLGFSVNKEAKIYGPGEWVSGKGKPVTSVKLVSSAGGYNVSFTIYCKNRGWSSWGKIGDELSFGPEVPIESISVWIKNN